MPNKASPEKVALTSIRGILALWVVGFHWFLNTRSHSLEAIFGQAYLSVDIFFILSGLILCDVYQAQKSFIEPVQFFLKRFFRVWPVHVLAMTMLTLVFIYPEFEFSWDWDYSLSLMFFQAYKPLSNVVNPPAWSISVEWVCYLLFPFILLFLLQWFDRPVFRVLCLLLALLLLYLVDLHFGTEIQGLNAVLRALAAFVSGMVMSLYAVRLDLTKAKSNALCTMGIVFIVLILTWPNIAPRIQSSTPDEVIAPQERQLLQMIQEERSHLDIAKTMDDQGISVKRLSELIHVPEVDLQALYNNSNPGGRYDHSVILVRLKNAVTQIHFNAWFPLFGGLILLGLYAQNGLLANILSGSIFHYLGKISYSIYLLHFPVLLFFEKIGFFPSASEVNIDLHFAFKIAVMVVTLLVISSLSFYRIERPARRLSIWLLQRKTAGP